MNSSQDGGRGPELTPERVRELAGRRGSPAVTTVYLDLDGTKFPRASDYEASINHVFRLARQRAAALGQDAVNSVEADLVRLREWLSGGVDRSDTRGIAAYACDREGFFRVLPLPVPVRDQVVVGPAPAVSQLCEILENSRRALLVMADRRRSRFVRLEMGRTEEVAGPFDEPPRRVDTDVELGGFQPYRDEAARRHLREVARAVADELECRPADDVVLGGPAEVVAELRQQLRPDVQARVVGRIAEPMRTCTVDVAGAALELLDQVQRHRHEELVDDVRQRSERASGGVTGLPATLRSLGDGRVELLVVEPGFEASGGRCPACGQLVAGDSPCPRCGEAVRTDLDVVEAAVSDALAQDAAVEVIDVTELGDMGHIGAVERF